MQLGFHSVFFFNILCSSTWYQSFNDSTMASHSSLPTRLTSSSHHPILPMVIPCTLAHLNIRLNHTNYTFWRFQILPTVRAHDLEGFLFGTKIKPKEFIIDPLDSNSTLNNPDYFFPDPSRSIFDELALVFHH